MRVPWVLLMSVSLLLALVFIEHIVAALTLPVFDHQVHCVGVLIDVEFHHACRMPHWRLLSCKVNQVGPCLEHCHVAVLSVLP
jgi:hypothetical protein